jgi:hypothetical protein
VLVLINPTSLLVRGGVKERIKQMKFKSCPNVKPASEALNASSDNYGRYYISVPMKWNIFGKDVVKNVDFQVNQDGSMNLKVVDAFNKFFANLESVIKSNMKLILEAVNNDASGIPNSKPVTQSDIAKNFKGLSSCFVCIDKIDAGGQLNLADHIVAHCSLEWNWDTKQGGDERFDSEHGNGFAMIDGKFYMGKPGDFY